MQKISLFILLCLTAFFARAIEDTLFIQNLRHMWISIDARGNMAPYTADKYPELIFFEITEPEQHGDLLLQSQKPVDVWLNNKLIFYKFDSSAVLDLDSLFEEEKGQLKFKIFSAGGIDESLVTRKILIGKSLQEDYVNVSQRERTGINDLYILILSILLLMTGIFKRFFPGTFRHSIQNPLSFKVRSASADRYESFGSIDNLYSVFFLGAITTLFFLYLGYDVILIPGKGVVTGLINWLVVSLAISLGIGLKYLWTKLICVLFQFREIPGIQLQDFIRFFTLVILIGTCLTLLDFSFFNSTTEWFRDLTVYLVLFSLLFFQVWFFRKFDNFYSHKKLMIFSYLCTTEFLPGFLAIYWLVKM